MSLTGPEREAVAAILSPIKAGRTNVVRRTRRGLGDPEFVDGLLGEAGRMSLAALEIDGSIVIFQPGIARWLLNPQAIAAPAA